MRRGDECRAIEGLGEKVQNCRYIQFFTKRYHPSIPTMLLFFHRNRCSLQVPHESNIYMKTRNDQLLVDNFGSYALFLLIDMVYNEVRTKMC
uniref:NADH dehydrogenase subunit 6 n=1 Tax=Parascaris univalens TaxID=6257 RepID=A0A915AAF9_PARUN